VAEPASVKWTKPRKEIGDALLREVQRCAEAYHKASEHERGKAYQLYIHALDRFNDFVLHGVLPRD